jgi:hypothetical protein
MKILVIGLDGAPPAWLLEDERLANVRQLMEAGCYGRLETVVPSTSVPAWMSLATGQDPGRLGVYGPCNRPDRSYTPGVPVRSWPAAAPAIWDQLAREDRRTFALGILPGTSPHVFSHPPEIGAIAASYPTGFPDAGARGQGPRAGESDSLRRSQFQVVRNLMQEGAWDYLQFVAAVTASDEAPALDEEIGGILERLNDDTLVLVASIPGTEVHEGAFDLNAWLVREGLLVLDEPIEEPTPFSRLAVNWERTRAWGAGGPCGQLFLNVRGREPRGAIDAADAREFREALKARLEAATDADGKPLGVHVFRPEEVYRDVRSVAPDLIVQLGESRGAFVLAGGSVPAIGPVEGIHLLDLAPTLLELAGHEVPDSMQGRSLASAGLGAPEAPPATDLDDEELVRMRLSGLGYL